MRSPALCLKLLARWSECVLMPPAPIATLTMNRLLCSRLLLSIAGIALAGGFHRFGRLIVDECPQIVFFDKDEAQIVLLCVRLRAEVGVGIIHKNEGVGHFWRLDGTQNGEIQTPFRVGKPGRLQLKHLPPTVKARAVIED